MLIDKHHKLQDISNWLIDIDEQKTTVDMSKFYPEKIKKQWIKLIENALEYYCYHNTKIHQHSYII